MNCEKFFVNHHDFEVSFNFQRTASQFAVARVTSKIPIAVPPTTHRRATVSFVKAMDATRLFTQPQVDFSATLVWKAIANLRTTIWSFARDITRMKDALRCLTKEKTKSLREDVFRV